MVGVILSWFMLIFAFCLGVVDIALIIYIINEEKRRKEQRKKDKIFFKMLLKEMENIRGNKQ